MEDLEKEIKDVLQALEQMIEEEAERAEIEEQREILDRLLKEYLGKL